MLRDACAADGRCPCSGVSPGGGHIVPCVGDQVDTPTPTCKAALAEGT